MIQDQVSVIIRFHDPLSIPQLKHALESLANQTYPSIQAVLVVQNGSDSLLHALAQLMEKAGLSPSGNGTTYKVFSVSVPSGVDGRSRLLNQGIIASQGQYLAFLDYDDIVYPNAYEKLIRQAKKRRLPITVGGCTIANQQRILQSNLREYTTISKQPYLKISKTKWDLFDANFIPIHSFIVDRSQVSSDHLIFNESLKCFEDYEVLLKWAAQYDFDLTLLFDPVAEYRIREDGTNTIINPQSGPAQKQEWMEAKEKIDQLKSSLKLTLSGKELEQIFRERALLLEERNTFFFRMAQRLRNFVKSHPRLRTLGSRVLHLVQK